MQRRPKIKNLITNPNLCWFVDLDNTLYQPNGEIFSILDRRICYYLSYKCRCNLAEAENIRRGLFNKYKNTFVGSLKEKIIDILEFGEFLDFVHNFDVDGLMVKNERLDDFLSMINGRKFVFSNSVRKYAQKVLLGLNMGNHFERIFSIEDFDYNFKPNEKPYRFVIDYLHIEPFNTIVVDDIQINLSVAQTLEMKTLRVREIERFMDDEYGQKNY